MTTTLQRRTQTWSLLSALTIAAGCSLGLPSKPRPDAAAADATQGGSGGGGNLGGAVGSGGVNVSGGGGAAGSVVVGGTGGGVAGTGGAASGTGGAAATGTGGRAVGTGGSGTGGRAPGTGGGGSGGGVGGGIGTGGAAAGTGGGGAPGTGGVAPGSGGSGGDGGTLCQPNADYCTAGAALHCSSDGARVTINRICFPDQQCNAAGTSCMTVPPCAANQPACDGTTRTTCNADGTGYVAGGVDCGLTGNVCLRGACVPRITDMVAGQGHSTPNAENQFLYNYYAVTESRTLLEIEQRLSAQAVQLTWAVYEATSQTGTYHLIFARMKPASASLSYQTSGPVDISLVAGRFYAIGVGWGLGMSTYGYDTVPSLPVPVSFGSVISTGAVNPAAPGSISWRQPTSSGFFVQRFGTVAAP